MRGFVKILLTSVIILVAMGAFAFKYWDYITNPWTRDWQVRANVIQVSRVSGPIVKLPIKDNQFVKADADFQRAPNLVKKGDISKRQFDSAKATYDVDQADLDKAQSALIPDAHLKGIVDSIGCGASPNRVAALARTCCPASAPPSSGSAWPNGSRCVFTYSRCPTTSSCVWAPPLRFWS